MLNPNQLRSLVSAIYALVFMVMLMLSLTLAVAWLQPSGQATVADAGAAPVGGAAAPVAKALSADAQAGKAIFEGNCAACHNTSEVALVGPGLKGVRQRTPGEAWLQKWIRNSSAVISSGDAYAVKVFNQYNKLQMTSFPNLSDQQIKQLLDYVDASN
jgi:mono/diheme cytochrome c family protein